MTGDPLGLHFFASFKTGGVYGDMKRIRQSLTFILILLLFSTPLFADGTSSDGVKWVDDGAMTEWFITCYDALAQKQGMGGYILFSTDGEALSSWLSEGTPKDFFVNLPPSTLTIPQLLPVPACAILCEALGDKSSVAMLEEYMLDNAAVVMVIAFKTYQPITLDLPYRALVRQEIEKSVGQLGMNNEEFYSLFESKGIEAETLTDRVLAGENPRDIALEGLSLKQSLRQTEDKGMMTALAVVLGILGLGVVITLVPVLRKNKEENDEDEK